MLKNIHIFNGNIFLTGPVRQCTKIALWCCGTYPVFQRGTLLLHSIFLTYSLSDNLEFFLQFTVVYIPDRTANEAGSHLSATVSEAFTMSSNSEYQVNNGFQGDEESTYPKLPEENRSAHSPTSPKKVSVSVFLGS